MLPGVMGGEGVRGGAFYFAAAHSESNIKENLFVAQVLM